MSPSESSKNGMLQESRKIAGHWFVYGSLQHRLKSNVLTRGVSATAKYRFIPINPASAPAKVKDKVTIVKTCMHMLQGDIV